MYVYTHVCVCVCVYAVLYMCPHTTICTMCPHTSMYAIYDMCPLILHVYMCADTNIGVEIVRCGIRQACQGAQAVGVLIALCQ